MSIKFYSSKISLGDQNQAPTEKKKTKKEPYFIDFINGPDVVESVVFKQSSAPINLQKINPKSKMNYLLPDDLKFSSKDLLKLFLKPDTMVGNLI